MVAGGNNIQGTGGVAGSIVENGLQLSVQNTEMVVFTNKRGYKNLLLS